MDFTSNKDLGKKPRNAEIADPSLHGGLSVMDTLERALERAREYPMQGTFVAELTIPTDSLIMVKRTTKTPGHYTLFGNADTILRCVTQVISVASLEVGQP
jgi:hypothetical protein